MLLFRIEILLYGVGVMTADYLHERYRPEGKCPQWRSFYENISRIYARFANVRRKPEKLELTRRKIRPAGAIGFEHCRPSLTASRAESLGHWWGYNTV